MLMIQSNEGQVKLTAIGTSQEICAETASAIRGLAEQLIRATGDTEKKRFTLNMLRAALEYAIDAASKEVHT